MVPGLHPVRELLIAGVEVTAVHVAEGRGRVGALDDLLERAEAAGVPVRITDRGELDRLTGGVVHQGVVATAPAFRYLDVPALLAAVPDDEPALLVALDGVTDPHNLGSVARTADAAGAHGLLLTSRRAAGVGPAAEKAGAGALAHLPVARATNLVRALEQLGERGIWSVGLDAAAALDARDCALLEEPVVLLVGAEGRGLARLTRERCDQLIRLPMRGHVASLNASVAVGVALYAASWRRDGSSRPTDPG